jgi:hypothetical protein
MLSLDHNGEQGSLFVVSSTRIDLSRRDRMREDERLDTILKVQVMLANKKFTPAGAYILP